MFSGLQEMFSSEQEMFSWEQEQEMFSLEQKMFSSEQEMFSWEQEQEMFSLEQQMSQQQISTPSGKINEWRVKIEEHLEEAMKAETTRAWDDVCIPRVPRKLRDVNPSAFDPQFVSIGPYHRGKDVLRDMEIHKWRCFRQILNDKKQGWRLYFGTIAGDLEQVKRCYEEIDLCDYEWVETMVLDGCFLLDILFGFSGDVTYFEKKGYSKNDPVYSKRGPIEAAKEDMLKLENQLPLFILERLLGLISIKEGDKTDLIPQKVLKLFGLQEKIPALEFNSRSHCLQIYRDGLLVPFRRGHPSQFATSSPKDETEIGLCAAYLAPLRHFSIIWWGKIIKYIINLRPSTNQQETTHQQETIRTATMLREAGVKFKKRKTDCFLDIKYEAGVLYIPYLLLNGIMKSLIHNLIAFEQIYHGEDNSYEITRYAAFMDDLIDTSADVAYLHDLGIIDPSAGGSFEDAAAFFNKITGGVIFVKEDKYLQKATEELLKKINGYHNSRIRNWMVGTKSKYFSNPWSIISLIAAIALLVLTFLQTFYGMYGYYRPRN